MAKTYKHLYNEVVDFENLWQAYCCVDSYDSKYYEKAKGLERDPFNESKRS